MVKVDRSIRWMSISLVLLLACSITLSQEQGDVFRRLSKSSEQFALELFEKMTNNLFTTSPNNNIILSPLSVWSLLLLVAEGSGGNTFTELRAGLRLTEDIEFIRNGIRDVINALNVNTSTVELAQVSAGFFPSTKPLLPAYEELVKSYYKTSLVPVNFANPEQSLADINDFVRRATRNQIKKIVDPGDVQNTALLLASAIYFRGEWKIPFNETLTKKELFYNENNEVIGYANMMSQTSTYSYTLSRQLGCFLLEIPYGKLDRLAMIILLPQKDTKLRTVIKSLTNVGATFILEELRKADDDFGETEIEVQLPRFGYRSSYNLNYVLSEMGIKDVFNAQAANLSGMSNDPLYLSRIVHQAKIKVNEKGTVAAAVTTGNIMYKQTPQHFAINRPFAYLIMDKATNSVLFMGSVVNPVKQAEEDEEERKNRSNLQKLNIFTMFACTCFIALYMSVVSP